MIRIKVIINSFVTKFIYNKLWEYGRGPNFIAGPLLLMEPRKLRQSSGHLLATHSWMLRPAVRGEWRFARITSSLGVCLVASQVTICVRSALHDKRIETSGRLDYANEPKNPASMRKRFVAHRLPDGLMRLRMLDQV